MDNEKLFRFEHFSNDELQTIQKAICWDISVADDGGVRLELANEITGEILRRRGRKLSE